MSISMGNGIVIRLAGVRQPTTRIFHQEVISIGTAADCDVVIEAEEFSLPTESIRWLASRATAKRSPSATR
jgi:hypothetical protein